MPDPSSLQSRKQELVRSAIWDAAIDLFAEKGFGETTVDDIAQAAGVSRRSFFRYFSSKNDLMAEGILSYRDALTDAISARPRGHSPLETVHCTVLQVASQAAANPRTLKIMRLCDSQPEARQAQLARSAELEDSVAESFAQRTRSRSAKKSTRDDIHPRLLAGLTLTILGVTFRTWFLAHAHQPEPDISVTVEQVFRTLRRLFIHEVAR